MAKIQVSSESPYVNTIGYSRAVRTDNIIAVSGTAPLAPDGTTAYQGDAYAQTRRCLEIVKEAITEAGGSLEDVIRTRIMLKDISFWQEVARAHGEFFSRIKPACTFVEVKGFVRDDWLVEIEADCVTSEK
jgi:enamine deaminase RidA (YjgF/YER057c/UK114 family)